MVSKIIFVVFIIIMLGLGSFFIVYGIKGGLIEKKILSNAWRQQYVTGRDAVIRGWFYVSLGVAFIVVLILGISDILKR